MSRVKKAILFIISGIILISGTLADAAGRDAKFTLDVREERISLHADNADVKDILYALESKIGIKVVIYKGMAPHTVSLDIEDLPLYALDTLLGKMSLKNTAMVYDKKLTGLAVYVLPEGKSIQEIFKGNSHLTRIADADYLTGKDATQIKGKKIITDRQ